MALPILARRAAQLGAPLDASQLEAFETYRDRLLDWNRRVNLTAITDPERVETRHFVDSLTALPLLDDLFAGGVARVIDIGSGGGFPGVPLKLAQPRLQLTLLDSVGKKTAFLADLVARLRLDDVQVITGRAEDVGRDPDHRERYDAVVARALAPLPVLLELCLPFARVGGRLVTHRRGDLAAEQRSAAYAAAVLGGRFRPPAPVGGGPDQSDYGLVVADKMAASPTTYPRRAGLPARRPLRSS